MPVLPESTKADFLIYTRVVYRSNNNANANGGVSYANANNDSSNANTNIGCRLANNLIITQVKRIWAYNDEDVSST